MRALITDFGVSKIINDQTLQVKAFQKADINGGSLCYAPPEVLQLLISWRSFATRNTVEDWQAADIFAMAVVMAEIAIRKDPWKNFRYDIVGGDKEESKKKAISNAVFHGERPFDLSRLEELPRIGDLVPLITACWHQDLRSRPRIGAVLEYLNEERY